MPAILNTLQNYLSDVTTSGWYIGVRLTEHTTTGAIYNINSVNCVMFDNGSNAAAPSTYKGNSVMVGYLWTANCTHQIAAGGSPTTLHVLSADLETRANGGVDVYDPNNYLHGIVNFLNPYANDAAHGSTGQCTITQTGGTNLFLNPINCPTTGGGSTTHPASTSAGTMSLTPGQGVTSVSFQYQPDSGHLYLTGAGSVPPGQYEVVVQCRQ